MATPSLLSRITPRKWFVLVAVLLGAVVGAALLRAGTLGVWISLALDGTSRLFWPLLVAVFAVLLLLCVLVFPRYIVGRGRLTLDVAKLSGDAIKSEELRLKAEADRLKAENDVRTTLLQGLAGLVLFVGAVLTALQLQATLERNREELKLSQEGQVTERFTRAIAQLGGGELAVRLGGIYALERIAKDSDRDHGPIMEVLTAFIRERVPAASGTRSSSHRATSPAERAGIRWSATTSSRTRAKPPADIQAILTVLGRLPDHKTRLNLGETDLRSAYLEGANLQGAILIRANLQGAHLTNANLREANLIRANLQEADLSAANLQEASLARANLHGADLTNANLQGALLMMANLQEARLDGTNLYGTFGLTREQLEQAWCTETTRLPRELGGACPGNK